MITQDQALDMFRSNDLVGIGMEADAIRQRLHPGNIATYIIDRNINYTNFCTEYCSFCAFYRPMGHKEGYVLDQDVIFDKGQTNPAIARENEGWRCPAERLNRHRYHDDWLQNLLISASLGGYRSTPPQNP